MPLYIPKPTSNRTLQPQGTHVARIVSMIQIGTHQKEGRDGKPWEVAQARITFELPLETKVFREGDAPKPLVITKEYSLLLGEKANLRKLIEAVIGTTLIDAEAYAFDVYNILGKPCAVTIKHKTNPTSKETYAYVESVNSLMKGVECPPQINPTFLFMLSPFDEEKFSNLPEFIREKIMKSPEYKSRLTQADKETITALRDGELDAFAKSQETSQEIPSIDPADIPF